MTDLIQDPYDPSVWFIGSHAEGVFGAQVGAGTLTDVHHEAKCAGRHCVMHNPSDHHMRSWPVNWRDDKKVMERTCPHGIGHPDPDDMAYNKLMGRSWLGVHGCDGCCQRGPE